MTRPVCSFADEDVPRRYVAGTLTSAEYEAFEVHLLQCSVCQDAVEEASELRSALRVRRAPYRLPAVIAAAAAAAIVLVMLGRRTSALERLGRVDAPAFDGIIVRAQPDSAAAAVQRGMTAYRNRQYAAAAEALSRAVGADSDPGVSFFLGASQLLNGAPRLAIERFRVLTASAGPYAREARYYTAKAWLQLDNRDSALAVLRQGAPSAAMRALADSISALRR